MHPHTLAIIAGRPPREDGAAVNVPISYSSTYVSAGSVEEPENRVYGRFSNATWEALEATIGLLERAEAPEAPGAPQQTEPPKATGAPKAHGLPEEPEPPEAPESLPALAFSSGMAAVAAALSLVPPGGLVLMPDSAYNGSLALAEELAAAGRIRLQRLTTEELTKEELTADGLRATMQEKGALLWLEVPSNPLLRVPDARALIQAAHAADALTVVDSTLATPLGARPLEWGADIALHSATKYLSGHSDVLLGVATAATPELRARLHRHRTLAGSIPSPMDAWLVLRGIRTLAVRLERQSGTAAYLAKRLAQHPAVRALSYPGAPDNPDAAAIASLGLGPGAMLAIQVGADAAAADRFIAALRLWVPATSLGGVESTIERRRRHPSEPGTVAENLVRLSVGLEYPEDLWDDLAAALNLIDPVS